MLVLVVVAASPVFVSFFILLALWGRPKLGRKERGGRANSESEQANPDLLEPHLLRSLLNVRIASVHTACSGCHFVCIDMNGHAWLFGRNGSSCLGVAGVDFISENAPRLVRADRELGAREGTRIVWAACGRNHTLLVGSDGSVWSAGANTYGQCGQPTCSEVPAFKLVTGISHQGTKEKAVMASAGVSFSMVLTESGKVFSFGSAEKGQLGNGTTGERITTGNKTAFDIEPFPIYIKELDGKKIVQIASGPQHSLAVDDTGVVYVWGYNGYCRLGLGNQVDALKPKVVPQFAGPNETQMGSQVVAGPTNSVVVDRQGMYWMAGKWKNSGEGSAGSPYSTFRYMQDIMGCKMSIARCGGVTHWAVTPDDDGSPMTVCWGQNAANGELGMGPEEPKSATKPTRNVPLSGLDVFDIAAGQNTTVLLARPSDKFAEMPRHPTEIDPPQVCVGCEMDHGDPLECDKCDSPWHLECLDPPLDAVPDGEWFCPDCVEEPGAAIGPGFMARRKMGKERSRKASGGHTTGGTKRKASGAASGGECGFSFSP
ncbi:hypothetical protein AMATHDRAFT_51137 [Amanita thiersii Skay4041]|uniref:PHD-type domain-containing protein n=1 Tax=Amanita thiersii Skay4041 TaxID=703135 RepID=A0A2A9NDH7_9AGAR|nr:hypothetical protein AMATHDRAFT_51137 [Amanita thiersii Skay4041]